MTDAPPPFSTSVTMPPPASRAFVTARRIVTLARSTAWVFQSVAEALLRHCQAPRSCRVSLATSAVVPLPPPLALHATGRASETTALRLFGVPGFQASWQGAAAPCQSMWSRLAVASCWHPSSTVCACSTAPAKLHNAALHKVPAQSVASSFVSGYRFAPMGLRSRRYAKLPALVRACQPSAFPGRFAPYTPPPAALVVCRHRVFSRLLHKRSSQRLRRVSPACPAHPLALLAAQHRRAAARPPPRGSLQCRAGPCRLAAAPNIFKPSLTTRKATPCKTLPSITIMSLAHIAPTWTNRILCARNLT